MSPELRETLPFPNWVWLLGGLLIVVAVGWVLSLLIAYRVKRISDKEPIRMLGELQRRRYLRQIDEIQGAFNGGRMNAKEAHLALAALVRSVASEKSGSNVESMTAAEAGHYLPNWPILQQALSWCEDEAFPPGSDSARVETGVALAVEVVDR